MTDNLDDYLGDFIQESREMLENASECLLRLEKSPDNLDEINALFRALHTIKGSAGFFKLDCISEHAHRAENLLDQVRNRLLIFSPEVVDVLFASLDFISSLFDRCEQGQILELNEELLRCIARLSAPPDSGVRQPVMKLGEILVGRGAVSEEDVKEALEEQKSGQVSHRETATIRVREDKIMTMGNLSGELLVARNVYEYILQQAAAGRIETDAALKLLNDNLHFLTRLTNDVHNSVMAMSMVPVKSIFQKFGRIVRDIANKQGKKIAFILEGEDTEVDKRVGDMLSDPLVHLIRNSCDHGLETTHERRAVGKAEEGRLILRAAHQGTDLIIEIIDDGRGVDRRKLLAKAGARGLEVDENDDEAVLNLVFVAGLSTNDKATDLSGRGVGMDVVMNCVNTLRGKVTLSSPPGEGTTLTMMIPMSMGVNTVLLVEAGGAGYALPFEQVREVIKLNTEAVKEVKGNYFIHYRGRVIGLKFMDCLLNSVCVGSRRIPPSKLKDEMPVVIVNNGQALLGIAVDRFVRNMETAVKPLPAALAGNEFVSGVCVLGNGKLVLVLNGERFFY
ncbi:chemotaxis protein CheA [Desulfobacterota bacterium M19]